MLIVRPQAADELRAARRWYEQRQPGLGRDLTAEIARCLRELAAHPERFPIVEDGVRRALLRRYPYSIFFCVRGEDVLVIAVFHQRRDPMILQDRR